MLYWLHAKKEGQLTRGSYFKFRDERDELAHNLALENYEVTLNTSTDDMTDFSVPVELDAYDHSMYSVGGLSWDHTSTGYVPRAEYHPYHRRGK